MPPRASLEERTFNLTYTAEVHDIPPDAKQVEIWLPYPQSDEYQKILKVNVTSPYPTKIFTDTGHGNKIVYIKVNNPVVGTIPITMEFTVRPGEHVYNNFTQGSASSDSVPPASVQHYALAKRSVVIALTFTHSSSDWPVQQAFQRNSKSVFPCPLISKVGRSADIAVRLSSI